MWAPCAGSLSSKVRIASDFLTLSRIKQRWKTKTLSSEIGFPTSTSEVFLDQNPIHKLAVIKRLLIAAEFYFVDPVQKTVSQKHHKFTQNSVSFSRQSKQVSRCCINFLHELTCQILTNRSIKIGCRAWPTHDHGEKSQKQPSSLHVKTGWIFASEVSLKSRF